MGLSFVAGVFLLLQFVSSSTLELHSSLPAAPAPDVAQVAPPASAPVPPNVPMAPSSSDPSPSTRPSQTIQGTSTPASGPLFRLPSWPERNGKVAQLDSPADLPRRPPPLAPMSGEVSRPERPATTAAPALPPSGGSSFPQAERQFGNAVDAARPPFNPNGNFASAAPPLSAAPEEPRGSSRVNRKSAGRVFMDDGVPPPAKEFNPMAGPRVGSPAGPAEPQLPPPVPTITNPSTIPVEPLHTSAYWNSWFGDGAGPASNILIANNTYTFTLDIAAFDYASLLQRTQSSGTRVDKAFDTLIADPKVPETILTLKPMIPEGSGLRLVDDKDSYPMKVDLRKIRQPNADAAKQYADGAISITELSKQASAGSIQITVMSKGCATIAFAIFKGPRSSGAARIDRETDTSAPVCDTADPAHDIVGRTEFAARVKSGASTTAAAREHGCVRRRPRRAFTDGIALWI